MANDSQRGYLSGILHRGARIPSPNAAATPIRPFMPTIAPLPVPISNDFHGEIETFSEPAGPQKSYNSDRVREQPKSTTQILSQDSETVPATTTTTPPSEADSRSSAAPDNHPVLSPALPSTSDALPSQSPTSLDLTSTERNEWGERLPRIISAGAEKLRGNSVNQTLSDQQVVAESFSPSQNTEPGSTLGVVSQPAASIASTVNSIGDRSPKLIRIEESDAEITNAPTQHYQSSPVVRQQSQLPPHHGGKPVAAEPAAEVRSQTPEPHALREKILEREVIVAQAVPAQREPPVAWSPTQAAHDEFSMTRQQLPSPRQESPKLTINRLDVQIVNQSVPPVAPLPTPPAPETQLDGWNNLERYHLGHLDLIF